MSYQVISIKLVKTRKPHHCWGCTKEFPAGSMLWNRISKGDEIVNTYWCETCQELVDQDPDAIDGYMFGELTDYADYIREAHDSRTQKDRRNPIEMERKKTKTPLHLSSCLTCEDWVETFSGLEAIASLRHGKEV